MTGGHSPRATALTRIFYLIASLALAACASPTTPTPAATSVPEANPIPVATAIPQATATPEASPTSKPPTAEVITDLQYTISTRPGGAGWLLDVYVPAAPAGLPPVVIFGGMGLPKEGYGYQALAQSLAAEGAVVFLPNFAPGGSSGVDMFRTENGIALREELEAALCAVRFARAKSADYGGASERVLVIGHGGGGWDGIFTALVGDETETVWDTFADTRGGPPRQMECVEGKSLSGRPDIFLGYAGAYTYFYQVENEDPALFALVHPPPYVGRNTDVVLRFVEAKPDENAVHQRVAVLNEEFFESLRAAGYDVTWTGADTGYGIEAPSRAVVMEMWRELTASPSAPSAPFEVVDASSWDYVAIGGDFTYANGWAEVYAGFLGEDLGVKINFSNQSTHSALSLARWLEQLQTDEQLRQALRGAEIVTFDVPLEAYLAMPFALYHSGFCGGDDGQDCYRERVSELETELPAFLDELVNLAGPSDTLLRTFSIGTIPAYHRGVAGWGPTPTEDDTRVFAEHLNVIAGIIREVCATRKITVIDVSPTLQPDGPESVPREDYLAPLGLTEAGNIAVADLLRQAGYAYSRP